jgi:acetyl-CoA acetyltransferase family protein
VAFSRAVYVIDVARTPLGRIGGLLAGVRPDDLTATVIRALLDRTPTLDPATVDEVFLGAANQAGEDNRNVARMGALLAGLPTSVPGTTVNRLCASGLDAVIAAARAIAVGEASICIAGGAESMSRAPWVVPKPERAYPAGDAVMPSTTLGWRLVNPAMPSQWTVGLGEATEQLASKFAITRDASDEFAARSHGRAAQAWDSGWTGAEVVAVGDIAVVRDEGIRDDVTPESLSRLRPSFRPDGIVTAGNSSQLSDGAAALLLADDRGLAQLGVQPLARITATAAVGVEPQYFGIGPVEATYRALARAGRRLADVTAVELNEAFAAQSLACLSQLPELDPDIVNPYGGAIAVGHPLGCSGARLAGSVSRQLAAAGSGGVGLATLCVGVGQGVTVVFER